jgi:hypothetical protein
MTAGTDDRCARCRPERHRQPVWSAPSCPPKVEHARALIESARDAGKRQRQLFRRPQTARNEWAQAVETVAGSSSSHRSLNQ